MSVCPRCGTEFSCGMVDDKSDAPCWCTQFPPLPLPAPGKADATCYCPACLKTLTESAVAQEGVEPRPQTLI